MMKLCEPKSPEMYWINCVTYQCKSCGNIFDNVFPNGYDVVKLQEMNGDEIRWLPTYGKGGYLDLMTKLISGHSLNDTITMEKIKVFTVELNKYCEKGENGHGFEFNNKPVYECTNCNSSNTTVVNENTLTKPKLIWLKVACSLM